LQQVGVNAFVGVILGWIVYVAVFAFLGGFQGEDMAIIGRSLPFGRLRRLLPV
jgi:hypothetical protein